MLFVHCLNMSYIWSINDQPVSTGTQVGKGREWIQEDQPGMRFLPGRDRKKLHWHIYSARGLSVSCRWQITPTNVKARTTDTWLSPCFPATCFLKAIAAIQNLAPVRSTRGVVSMVRFGTELAVVPGAVINAIKNRMETTSGLIRIAPVPVNTGDKVRVFDGPLSGVSGIVEEWNSENRALILMELLGRSTRVEVDAMILQKTG